MLFVVRTLKYPVLSQIEYDRIGLMACVTVQVKENVLSMHWSPHTAWRSSDTVEIVEKRMKESNMPKFYHNRPVVMDCPLG